MAIVRKLSPTQGQVGRLRILIGDEEGHTSRQLAEHLHARGFDTRTTLSVNEAKELIEFWKPDIAIIDLTISLSLFRYFSLNPKLKKPPVIVTKRKSSLEVNEQIRRAGASDILEKPFSIEEVIFRIEQLMQSQKLEVDNNDPIKVKTQELHLLNIFMKQATTSPGDSHCLYNLMRMVSLRTGAIRASIVHVANNKRGTVIASNDDAYVRGYNLDLVKYPEILGVLQERKAKYIPDWQQCDYAASVRENLKKTPYESLAVFPLFIDYKFYGVMSLRMKRQPPHEAAYVQKLGDLCSKIISLTLRHTAESVAA